MCEGTACRALSLRNGHQHQLLWFGGEIVSFSRSLCFMASLLNNPHTSGVFVRESRPQKPSPVMSRYVYKPAEPSMVFTRLLAHFRKDCWTVDPVTGWNQTISVRAASAALHHVPSRGSSGLGSQSMACGWASGGFTIARKILYEWVCRCGCTAHYMCVSGSGKRGYRFHQLHKSGPPPRLKPRKVF